MSTVRWVTVWLQSGWWNQCSRKTLVRQHLIAPSRYLIASLARQALAPSRRQFLMPVAALPTLSSIRSASALAEHQPLSRRLLVGQNELSPDSAQRQVTTHSGPRGRLQSGRSRGPSLNTSVPPLSLSHWPHLKARQGWVQYALRCEFWMAKCLDRVSNSCTNKSDKN